MPHTPPSGGPPENAWQLSRSTRHTLQRLIHQQHWCWGADIRRPAGNLLLQYGLSRTPTPGGPRSGSTRYSSSDGIGRRVTLWGFGAAYARQGEEALFLDRYDPTPGLIPPALLTEAHARTDITPIRRTAGWQSSRDAQRLLVALCLWIARYERWVVDTVGRRYRTSVLSEWRHTIEPLDVDGAWRRLAWSVEHDLTERFVTAVRPHPVDASPSITLR